MFQCNCPPDNCSEKVHGFLAGDREAGDALACKFTPLVRGIVQRVLGSSRREEWDDACQAIFLRVFGNLKKWEERCPFCKWLAVVAARRAIDLSRLPDPMRRLPLEEVADTRPQSPDRETIERIEQAVGRFPPEWRRVWDGWVQGQRREEIARQCGKSLRTIHYWLAEMLDQLREYVSE
ncbi:MAG: RNA polymerase sigma factor [Gemmataceae bacterium]